MCCLIALIIGFPRLLPKHLMLHYEHFFYISIDSAPNTYQLVGSDEFKLPENQLIFDCSSPKG
jgi:hypothetical protein